MHINGREGASKILVKMRFLFPSSHARSSPFHLFVVIRPVLALELSRHCHVFPPIMTYIYIKKAFYRVFFHFLPVSCRYDDKTSTVSVLRSLPVALLWVKPKDKNLFVVLTPDVRGCFRHFTKTVSVLSKWFMVLERFVR